MPLFSVIIPCFNAGATIAGTLQSLQMQSCDDWEAICIDDGSTDATCQIIENMARLDTRISLSQNPGKGPSDARNHGAINLARGDLIAFCDADDLWHNRKLSSLCEAFADPTIDGVFGQIEFFRAEPGDTLVRSTVPAGPLTIEMLLGENPVCSMSNITVRTRCFTQSQGFAADMVHNEDLEWLVRLVGGGAHIQGLDLLHTFYRTSSGGLSSDLCAMEKARVRVLRSAARFGVEPSRYNHAIHHRYLARRALRLGRNRFCPLRHSVSGLAQSPSGFFSPPRRGVLTLAGAMGAAVLPAPLSRKLFS